MSSSNHPIFKVNVLLSIWKHEESVVQEYVNKDVLEPVYDLESPPKFTILHKELNLPFVPFPGLEIQRGEWECNPLVFVRWIEEDWAFRCTVPDEYPRQDINLSYEDVMAMCLDRGWVHAEFGETVLQEIYQMRKNRKRGKLN